MADRLRSFIIDDLAHCCIRMSFHFGFLSCFITPVQMFHPDAFVKARKVMSKEAVTRLASPLAVRATAVLARVFILVSVLECVLKFGPSNCSSNGSNQTMTHLLATVVSCKGSTDSSHQPSFALLCAARSIRIVVRVLAVIRGLRAVWTLLRILVCRC